MRINRYLESFGRAVTVIRVNFFDASVLGFALFRRYEIAFEIKEETRKIYTIPVGLELEEEKFPVSRLVAGADHRRSSGVEVAPVQSSAPPKCWVSGWIPPSASTLSPTENTQL